MSTHAVWRQVPAVLLIVGLAGAACGDDRSPEPPATPPSSEVFTAADGTRYAVEVVLTNLEVPWSLAFAPDGRLFITERPGRVRIAQGNALLPQPALAVNDVAATGEAGVMGIALHPSFSSNRFVYIAYTARLAGGGMVNRVVRYREAGNQLGEAMVIIDNIPAANIHDGCRIKFGPDGKLYVSMGDAAVPSVSQDLASLNGKILRMNDDGSLPADNPFPASFVYSLGHRNPQGIDWQPGTGELWGTEHGATGNDELNRLLPGRNYGWPVIEANRTQAGMETPVLFYDPAIAPSGLAFYSPLGAGTGLAIAGFRNNAFFATLRGLHLHRVIFNPGDPRSVSSEERLLENRFGRIRDVVAGPDGAIYFCTNNRDGRGSPAADDDRVIRIVAAR
jgi:glucose/arabinose dehydrogenase